MSSPKRRQQKKPLKPFDVRGNENIDIPKYDSLRDNNLNAYFKADSVQRVLKDICFVDKNGKRLDVDGNKQAINIIEQEFLKIEHQQELVKKESLAQQKKQIVYRKMVTEYMQKKDNYYKLKKERQDRLETLLERKKHLHEFRNSIKQQQKVAYPFASRQDYPPLKQPAPKKELSPKSASSPKRSQNSSPSRSRSTSNTPSIGSREKEKPVVPPPIVEAPKPELLDVISPKTPEDEIQTTDDNVEEFEVDEDDIHDQFINGENATEISYNYPNESLPIVTRISLSAPLATLYGVARKHLRDKHIQSGFKIQLDGRDLEETYGTTLEQAKLENARIDVTFK